MKALLRGLELRRAAAMAPDADPDATLDLAQSQIALGDLQHVTGEPTAALQSFEQARDLLEPFVGLSTASAPQRAAFARCLHGIARVWYETGRAADSLAFHERARAIREKLVAAHPDVKEFQSDLAVTYHEIGVIHRAEGASERCAGGLRARAGHPPKACPGQSPGNAVPE